MNPLNLLNWKHYLVGKTELFRQWPYFLSICSFMEWEWFKQRQEPARNHLLLLVLHLSSSSFLLGPPSIHPNAATSDSFHASQKQPSRNSKTDLAFRLWESIRIWNAYSPPQALMRKTELEMRCTNEYTMLHA